MLIFGVADVGKSAKVLELPAAAAAAPKYVPTVEPFSASYESTTTVMYSARRSLMTRTGSGCCAQVTWQFAVEEMISVTRACKSS